MIGQARSPRDRLRRRAAGGRGGALAAGHAGPPPWPEGARRAPPRSRAGSRTGARRRQAPDARPLGPRGGRLDRRRGRPPGGWHRPHLGLHPQGGVDPRHLPAQLPLGACPAARCGEPRTARPRLGGGGWAGRRSADHRSRLHDLRDLRPPQGGARHHGYTGVRGYHPLLAVAAGTGDVLMARFREGRANTVRGAAHFLRETIGRVRAAGATGPLTMRAGSGFYAHEVVAVPRSCGRHCLTCVHFASSPHPTRWARRRSVRSGCAVSDGTPAPRPYRGTADWQLDPQGSPSVVGFLQRSFLPCVASRRPPTPRRAGGW